MRICSWIGSVNNGDNLSGITATEIQSITSLEIKVIHSGISYTQLASLPAHYSGYQSLSSSVVSLISSVIFLSTAVSLLLIAVIKALSDQSYQGLQRSGIFFDLNGISL